jgi:hypothetical protein
MTLRIVPPAPDSEVVAFLPVVPCPPNNRAHARRALNLRLNGVTIEIENCIRRARELGDEVNAQRLVAARESWAVTVSSVERETR